MNADTLLHWLLRTSLEASLLILAVLGLRLMLGRRLSPAWRIGLWLLVGAKLMLPAFIPAGFGLGAWFQREEVARAPVAEVVPAVERVSRVDAGGVPVVSETAAAAAESAGMISGYTLALGVWLAGAALVFAAALYRQWRFNLELSQRRLATAPLLRALVASLAQKTGIRKQVRVLLMPAGTTPAVVGVLKPSILVPEDWEERFDEPSLRHVLLHELLHVKQHDLAWNWAATAVQALHWFNPLVWFVVSRFQADRELRCDAGALALLSPTERLDYGHTLLRIQESFFAPPAMAGLAPCVRNHPALRQRILMIAQPTSRQPVLHALLTATLGVLVCYSFTTARAVEKEVPVKERTREGARTPAEAEKSRSSAGDEDGAPVKTREGDGGAKKTSPGDGEGAIKKRPGTGDGEGAIKKRPGTGDGEGAIKKRPGTGDGEGGGKKTGARDGDKASGIGQAITLRVIKKGEAVMVGDEEVAMNHLRGHLSTFLPEHAGAKIIVTGEGDVPMSAMHNTMDAVRDNGNKNVRLQAE